MHTHTHPRTWLCGVCWEAPAPAGAARVAAPSWMTHGSPFGMHSRGKQSQLSARGQAFHALFVRLTRPATRRGVWQRQVCAGVLFVFENDSPKSASQLAVLRVWRKAGWQIAACVHKRLVPACVVCAEKEQALNSVTHRPRPYLSLLHLDYTIFNVPHIYCLCRRTQGIRRPNHGSCALSNWLRSQQHTIAIAQRRVEFTRHTAKQQ